MSLPVLIHDIGLQGGHRLYGRVICDTWLYLNTDRRISRGTLFTLYRGGIESEDYEITEVLMTSATGHQKFRVAKLAPNL